MAEHDLRFAAPRHRLTAAELDVLRLALFDHDKGRIGERAVVDRLRDVLAGKHRTVTL